MCVWDFLFCKWRQGTYAGSPARGTERKKLKDTQVRLNVYLEFFLLQVALRTYEESPLAVQDKRVLNMEMLGTSFIKNNKR